MAHKCQIIGSTESTGTSADDGDLFAGGFIACRNRNIAGVVNGHFLKAADVDGGVDQCPLAAVFTGVLTDVGTCSRHRIVAPDQSNGIRVALFMNQRNVSGNIHTGRT